VLKTAAAVADRRRKTKSRWYWLKTASS